MTFITCHLVLVNILSGRMYRKIKLGRDDQADARYVLSTLNFEAPSAENADGGENEYDIGDDVAMRPSVSGK